MCEFKQYANFSALLIAFSSFMAGVASAAPDVQVASPFKLSEQSIHQAKDYALLESRKLPKERRPAGLENIKSDQDIRLIIEASIPELGLSFLGESNNSSARLQYLGDIAFDPLVEALRHEHPAVRAMAARVSERRGIKATQPLIDAIHVEANWQAKSSFIDALSQTFDPRATDTILQYVRDENLFVQISAVRAFRYLRSKESIEPLLSLLRDDTLDGQVRHAAAETLLQIDRDRATRAIEDFISKSKDENLQHNLGVALKEKQDYGYWPPELAGLHQLTRDANTIKGEEFGYDEIRQLIHHIGSEHWAVSSACLLALGHLKASIAVPDILKLKPDNGAACAALIEIASPDALDAIIARINSNDAEVRLANVRAFGDHGGRWAVPILVDLLSDTALRVEPRAEPNFVSWPAHHWAHSALQQCLRNFDLPGRTVNLANSGATVNVDEEIKHAKEWWERFGQEFLGGKRVPDPALTSVFWAS